MCNFNERSEGFDLQSIWREQLSVHLRICTFVWPMHQQNHQNTTNTQKTPSDGNRSTMIFCKFVYLCVSQQNHSLGLSMWQASCKCEMPRLELKSSQTFLSIKRCEGTKIGKGIKQSRSSIYKLAHICATRGIPVNHGVGPFYTACHFNELSRGSVLCLLNASFENYFTIPCFTPKSMTMASAGAIWGKYWPDRGVQWQWYLG